MKAGILLLVALIAVSRVSALEHEDLLDWKTFLTEYQQKGADSTFPEVKTSLRYFPNENQVLDSTSFKTALLAFLDGSIYDDDLDAEITEASREYLQPMVDGYIEKEMNKNEFTLKDLWTAAIDSKIHEYIQKFHPPDEQEMKDLDEELKKLGAEDIPDKEDTGN
jgi:hypothetical protein